MRCHWPVVKKYDLVCVSGLYLKVQKFRMKTCYEIAFGIFTFLNQLEIVLDYNDSLRSNTAEMFINTTEQKFLIYEKRDILFVDGEIDHAFSA